MMKIRSVSHWVASGVLAALLIPGFVVAKLGPRVDFGTLLGGYWGLLWQSTAAAAVLALAMGPVEHLRQLAQHYWSQKPRFVVLGAFVALMLWEFGWLVGLMVVVVGVAVAEWLDRTRGEGIVDLLLPVAYFFAGLVMMCCYAAIGASLRRPNYDAAFNRWDSRIFGLTVPEAVSWASAHLPLWWFQAAETVYYNTFATVGAAVLILALAKGRAEAIRMVGAMLIAYYLGFAIFLLWPSIGPFALSAAVPPAVATAAVEKAVMAMSWARWIHLPIPVTAEEYIAFPSMHLALPLIVLWFLRKWRRIMVVLVAFDLLLVASIVLLEWHYFVDLLGGAVVAALAIWLTAGEAQAPHRRVVGSNPT